MSAIRPAAPHRAASAPAPRRYPGLLLGTCLILFASKVVWYDLRIVFPQLRGNVFRILLTGQAVALFPLIAIAFLMGTRAMFKSRTVACFLAMIVLGGVVAILQGVEYPAFVAQDVIKLLFVPAAFALVWIDPPASLGSFILRIANIVLGFQILKMVCFLVLYHGRMGLYYGGVMDTFPFCVYAARYCTRIHDDVLIDGIRAGISMLILTAGQKRTLLGIIAVVSLYLVLRNLGRVIQKPSIYLLGGVFLAGVSFFSGTIIDVIETRMARVVIKTVESDAMIESSARLREISIIDDTMELSDSLTRIFGYGHGAAFDDDVGDEVTGETLTHSVHFTPYAMYLRYGYVGWGFFLFTVLGVLLASEKADGQWCRREDVLAMKTFGISVIVGSLAIFGLMDDMFIGFILGSLAVSKQLEKRQQAVNDQRRNEANRRPMHRLRTAA